MKKLIILPVILLFCLPFLSLANLSTHASENIYAKIETNGVYLYSKCSSLEKDRLFEIPNSYFVRLIDNAENKDFYYCAYKDVYGYVLKNEVTPMKGLPASPFIEATFRVFLPDGIGLYNSPIYLDQYKTTTIPYLTDNLTYYGITSGQEVIPDKSSVWIYCKYNYSVNSYGYVYSVFCDKLPNITTNNERFDIVVNPFATTAKSQKEMTSVTMGLIIVGVSLPCLVVLFLLIKPSLSREKMEKAKPKLRAKKGKDYFEFNDNDLN